MALVCDIKSDVTNESSTAPIEATTQMTSEPQTEAEQQALDLEDGEIEDDEEEVTNTAEKEQQQQQQQQQQLPQQQQQQIQGQQQQPPPNDQKPGERRPEKRRHEKKHLTEAEKHVMHLHRLERLEREKREKYKREQGGDYLGYNHPFAVIDDFASNIERALANAMKKDRGNSEEERDDEKRGRKRKKKEKDKKKNKFRKFDAQPMDVPDELEQTQRGVQGPTGVGVTAGFSPTNQTSKEASPIGDDYDSNDSEYSSDRSREDRRDRRKEQGATGGGFRRGSKAKKDGRGGARDREGGRKFRERSRERWNNEPQPKDASNLCLFYLQGKCSKADDCPYSHGTVSAMKLELCKFYLTDCCAKGDKCLYMHSDFPCKFYHTGLTCNAGESCKFAHGKPLNEGLRQILYKHIETAPREILGGFPRMSRDEALNMIAQTQKGLELKYGTVAVGGACDAAPDGTLRDDKPKDKPETKRNRPSRWQDPDPPVDAQPHQLGQFPFALKGFYSEQDQDLRVNSNGDIDMRTLTMPPPSMNQQTNAEQTKESERAEPDDVKDTRETEDGVGGGVEFLPKKQRELYLRIQAQQKDNVVEYQKEASDNEDRNIDWYSDDDDDDDNRLTIKDDVEDVKEKTDEGEETAAAAAAAVVASSPVVLPFSTPEIKPGEFIEKLGDLSKIDISAEVTRLLSSISAQTTPTQTQPATRDPRQAAQHPTTSKPLADPRRTRSSSTESRRDKISIYEQGSITTSTSDVDLRTQDQDTDLRDTDLRQQQQQQQQRPDIDLRNLGLQFKGIANYTPATEIDATIASHPPMPWRVHIVDIPRPDYTGLKLSAQDAQVTGDPRLRKIFRLSVDEKDSPASPKQSPRSSHHHVATTPLRVDPRRRKAEEKEGMTYTQQLAVLQSSAFYQSLTSNQKLLLNQELATRADQTGAHDPVLNGILTNLGLVGTPATANANVSALSILASVNNLSNPLGNVLGQNPNILTAAQNHLVNPNLMNQMAQSMVQPGLLGAAPGIPNLPPDFSMGFDPRNGGLLGSGPPPPYAGGGYQGGGGGGGDGYNNYGGDEYYDGGGPGGGYDGPPVGGGGGGGGGGPRGRGFGRDNRSRRGGRGFNRNNQRKFRTANRRRNMSP